MRLFLILFSFSMVIISSMTEGGVMPAANTAEDCTGDDCSQPQGGDGHDCEKREQTIS